MKICKKCGVSKEPNSNNFYKQSKRKPDGLHPWCKDCCKSHQKKTLPQRNARERERWAIDDDYRKQRLEIQRGWIERNREHKREVERRNRLKNPEPYKERQKRYSEKHKGKLKKQKRATMRVLYEVKMGRMNRPKICERCGKEYPIIEAAHHDYNKPLDIEWLCKPCHATWDYHEPKLMNK